MDAVVVVADDDAVTRDLLALMLRARFGVEVVQAADGEQALRELRRVRARVLVTDLGLPLLDGLALVRAVRADPAWRGLGIVAVSGRLEREAAARDAGADGFVRKPFTMDALAAAVGPHLRAETDTA